MADLIPFMGMGFERSSERAKAEVEARRVYRDSILRFGVNFLDRSFRGILPTDLVLIGAPSGIGKTQFAVNIALANLMDGKRVHFIALEAEPMEIERRIKYNLIADSFYADPARPSLGRPLAYIDWLRGEFDSFIGPHEEMAETLLTGYRDLWTFYKTKGFGINDLIENMHAVEDETDLLIVDHVHYFDFEDENENRALKEIAKNVRDVCQIIQKPIILIAHLRKKDRRGAELVAGLDEFHGSSDLTKIATKVITLAPGKKIEGTDSLYETYIRIPKCRVDSSVTKFVGSIIFDTKRGAYQDRFKVGRLTNHGTDFEPLEGREIPFWLR